MRAHQSQFRVMSMCRVLGVSRSGYYAWRHRPPSARAQANRLLLDRLRQLHAQTREAYGTRRLWQLLRRQGLVCGRHRVARLRRLAGIRTRRVRRFQWITQSQPHPPAAPNRLAQWGPPRQPNQIWAGDITSIPTRTEWLHLAVVLDLFSRRVVGWSMSTRIKQDLVRDALMMALDQRRPGPGLLHHSDQGRQYLATAYQTLLSQAGFVSSMSRKGNAYDNATVESFFSSLKNELVHHETFPTPTDARVAIFEYIELFYNSQRLHQSLGYCSPMEFERLNPVP